MAVDITEIINAISDILGRTAPWEKYPADVSKKNAIESVLNVAHTKNNIMDDINSVDFTGKVLLVFICAPFELYYIYYIPNI